jgi:hypothetical protein
VAEQAPSGLWAEILTIWDGPGPPTEAIVYRSIQDIARLLDVGASTVSLWVNRQPDDTGDPCPRPDAIIGRAKGWLPERDDEWRAWVQRTRSPKIAEGRSRRARNRLPPP